MKAKLVIFLILNSSFLLSAYGGSATWNLNPVSGDWNTAANWTPATVPNGSSDIATFAVSNNPGVSLSAATTVNSVVFGSGASSFTVTEPGNTLTISGTGIVNNSGVTQNFVAGPGTNIDEGGLISFTGAATAGTLTAFTTNVGGARVSSSVSFFDSASAATASFVNNGSSIFGASGRTDFYNNSSADQAMVVCNGAPANISLSTGGTRSEEHTSELQSQFHLVCRLLLEKK